MNLFVSDLDNTLIYSYKREIGKDKILVETKDEKELSYMSAESHQMLQLAVQRFCFVPVTTRSLEQYRRIRFFSGWTPPYALVCNGGILLKDGKEVESWYRESKQISSAAEPDLTDAERLLSKDPFLSFEIRRVDGLFVYTKSERPEETMQRLRIQLDPQKTEILNNGTKVYVLPKGLNKGTAVKRLKSLLRPERIIAAGDSEFDIPMLMEADTAWFPQELNMGDLEMHPGKRVARNTEIFSDQLLTSIVTEIAAKKNTSGCV